MGAPRLSSSEFGKGIGRWSTSDGDRYGELGFSTEVNVLKTVLGREFSDWLLAVSFAIVGRFTTCKVTIQWVI